MKQIERYECEICHTLHPEKSEALSCEVKCKADAARQKNMKSIEKKRTRAVSKLCDLVRMNATSLIDIKDCLIKYTKEVLGVTLVITKWDMRFEPHLSNSRSCPIEGVTNWQRKNDIPDSYPGWTGNIAGKFPENPEMKAFHILRDSGFMHDDEKKVYNFGFRGIHTRGGSGGNSFSYSIEMFLDDFPKLCAKYVRYKNLDEIKREYEKLTSDRLETVRENVKKALDASKKYKELVKNSAWTKREAEQAEQLVRNYESDETKVQNEIYDSEHTISEQMVHMVKVELPELNKTFSTRW